MAPDLLMVILEDWAFFALFADNKFLGYKEL